MGFEVRELTVNGQSVVVDVSELTINDIDQAQRTSTRMIAYWASVLGSAEAEKELADAHYRRWRATCAEKLLAADPKIAEWKVKNGIEAHPDFVKLKSALAQAIDHATTARGMFEACLRRANLAQSVGAAKRETIKAFGSTETTKNNSDFDDDDEAPKNAVIVGDTDSEKKTHLKSVLKKKGSK